MQTEIRPARPDEMGEFGSIGGYVYGGAFGDGPETITATANLPEWTLCAFVDGKMASMFCTIPFTMRVAGNAMPMGGISSVGTLPEFRRQGLSRKLMTKSLEMMHEQGQTVASLWASQAAIYQRYQFAMTTVLRNYSIDTVDIRFHDGQESTCHVRQSTPAEDFDTIKALYIEFIRHRSCYLHRSKAFWQFGMIEEVSEEGPTRIGLSLDANNQPVGYVLYTLRGDKLEHAARSQEIRIREIVWLNMDAYRSLWEFIGAHDLVGRVSWKSAPLDDPIAEILAEPRMLHTRDNEGIWFRIVDVEGALAGRGYKTDGSIRLGIDDDRLTPWNNGVYELNVTDGVAEVRKTDAKPDIQLSLKTLSSLYTGFRS
ncbi:MAG TPA: GNAT family N-acetyltransferase, partial [Pseudomonadales bacterium]|nr:GNAT family N-acetyltransferase [Pseudomonadales bacterium]